MSKTFTHKREHYLRQASDFDCLQDFFQNLADEAFGKRLRAKMVDWLDVGMPTWTLNGQESKTFYHNDAPLATITISRGHDDTYQVVLRNNGVILKRDRMLELGHSDKLNCAYSVGCKGVGVKYAMASWVARHGSEMREPLFARTGHYRWRPHFTKENDQFTVHQLTCNSGDLDQHGRAHYFEWTIRCVRRSDLEKLMESVLWLRPPPNACLLFSSERGQIYAPGSSYAGRVYLNHYLACEIELLGGINLFPLRKGSIELTTDRRNIQRQYLPVVKQMISDLWDEYMKKDGSAITALYDIVQSDRQCLEVTMMDRFTAQISNEFMRRHGQRAYPVTNASVEDVRRRLRNSFDLVPVTQKLRDTIAQTLGEPEAILADMMKSAAEVDKGGIACSGKLDEVLALLRATSWKAVDIDERFPFVLPDGGTFLLNGYYIQGDHSRICEEGSECARMEWCAVAFWVEKLAKYTDMPLRAAFKVILDTPTKRVQDRFYAADGAGPDCSTQEGCDESDSDADDSDEEDSEQEGDGGSDACGSGWGEDPGATEHLQIADVVDESGALVRKRKLAAIESDVEEAVSVFKKRMLTLAARHL
jgi:hypothetical protein